MLSWDYGNVKLHLGRELENRLKFASTLSVTFLDKEQQRGWFYSLKTGAERFATLHECNCRDSGQRRKSRMPCMHMFRLAMELGLMPWFKRSRLVGAIDGGAFVVSYLKENALHEIPPDRRGAIGHQTSIDPACNKLANFGVTTIGFLDVVLVESLRPARHFGWSPVRSM